MMLKPRLLMLDEPSLDFRKGLPVAGLSYLR